jgi:hypothetical protein
VVVSPLLTISTVIREAIKTWRDTFYGCRKIFLSLAINMVSDVTALFSLIIVNLLSYRPLASIQMILFCIDGFNMFEITSN